LRYIVACFLLLCCFSATVLAQGTSPAPQSLPFSQDFSTLDLLLQLILQDFKVGPQVAPSGSYVTTGTLGDRVLVANSTAATSKYIHNYNGKGFKHRITRSYH
jgi:hypothetical protein